VLCRREAATEDGCPRAEEIQTLAASTERLFVVLPLAKVQREVFAAERPLGVEERSAFPWSARPGEQ